MYTSAADCGEFKEALGGVSVKYGLVIDTPKCEHSYRYMITQKRHTFLNKRDLFLYTKETYIVWAGYQYTQVWVLYKRRRSDLK